MLRAAIVSPWTFLAATCAALAIAFAQSVTFVPRRTLANPRGVVLDWLYHACVGDGVVAGAIFDSLDPTVVINEANLNPLYVAAAPFLIEGEIHGLAQARAVRARSRRSGAAGRPRPRHGHRRRRGQTKLLRGD